ncbi:unnamed protein product [Menidia menidia]|uniref:(Atlantic silverside) hypothetical protein n=1 Tax=Menidia menidia TaxID=238744 RepID=A0A8S4BL59_9TELE|nr:unnamed protein product [Menidia menidia]
MDGHRKRFSPEVLYSMTEDAVGKFVQQIFLFMFDDTLDLIIENENTFRALQDIENLLEVGISPPEDTKAESESSQKSVPPSSSLSQAGEHREDAIINQGDEDVKETAQVNEKSEADEIIEGLPNEEDNNVAQANRESPELSAETLKNSLAMALLLRLLSKCETDNKNLKDSITEIKRRLLFLLLSTSRANTGGVSRCLCRCKQELD